MTTRRRPPWEILPDETTPAFQAFATYRDMGPDRATVKVAQELSKSRALVNRWCQKHSWVLRVRAYDAHEDQEHLRYIASQRRVIARRNLTIAGEVMVKAAAGLELLDPVKMRSQDVARLIEVASRLEALTLGEVTSRVAVTADPTAPLSPAVLAGALSDEDRVTRARMLMAELEARIGDTEADQL